MTSLIVGVFIVNELYILLQIPDVNPEGFKKDFNVGEKQYFVLLLGSLCAKKDWESIEKLLTPKVCRSLLTS